DQPFDDARKRGEAAEFLAATRARLVDGCPELRRASTVDESAADVAGDVASRFADALERSTCPFDLSTMRSFLWFALGNPFPHGVVTLTIAPDAPLVSQPGDVPWRTANARLTPDASVRLASE
ncbi:MAG: hypothetical protein LC798_08890, partial [Chloroflexi bacterium]|nr:hypothetical protein [Chloroflexota bacterium]